jgi:hypothetical protein
MILCFRTLANTCLILQAETGGHAILIDTSNNISCSGNIICNAITSTCSSTNTKLDIKGSGSSIFTGKIRVLNLFRQTMLHFGYCELSPCY